MAQGKEFTPEEKAMIIESLRPYLELGFSRNKSCSLIGLHPTTLSKWVQAEEALSMKITGWENVINATVLKNIHDSIIKEATLKDDLRKENSWKWAETKMKDEFSKRTDITSNGESITIPDEEKKNMQALINSFLDESE